MPPRRPRSLANWIAFVLVFAGIVILGIALGRMTGVVGTADDGVPGARADRADYWRGRGVDVRVADAFHGAVTTDALGAADTGEQWQSVSGTWTVDEQGAALEAGEDGGLAVLNTGSADGLVEVRLSVVQPGAGLVFRYRDQDNYWAITAVPVYGTWAVTKVVNGTPQRVTDLVWSEVGDGTTVSVLLNGSEVQFLVNGVAQKALADATFDNERRAGLVGPGGAARWDRFLAGVFSQSG